MGRRYESTRRPGIYNQWLGPSFLQSRLSIEPSRHLHANQRRRGVSITDLGQRNSSPQIRGPLARRSPRGAQRGRDNINALWNVIPESSTTIQPSKAVVLKRAKEHILELQQHARREKRKKEALEAKVQMLEHFLAEQPSTRGLKAQNVKYSVV